MIKKIERKIVNNNPLTNEEASEFLTYICKMIRADSGIVDPLDTNCKVCFETSTKFGRLMLIRFGCDVDILNIAKLLNIPLTHYANIISFNVNGIKKTYLVDMTYSQFFGDTIILDNNMSFSTEKTFGNITEENFVKKLRQFGFVELDNEILKKYINCFLDICKEKNRQIAYSNLDKLIISNKLNVK